MARKDLSERSILWQEFLLVASSLTLAALRVILLGETVSVDDAGLTFLVLMEAAKARNVITTSNRAYTKYGTVLAELFSPAQLSTA